MPDDDVRVETGMSPDAGERLQ